MKLRGGEQALQFAYSALYFRSKVESMVEFNLFKMTGNGTISSFVVSAFRSISTSSMIVMLVAFTL